MKIWGFGGSQKVKPTTGEQPQTLSIMLHKQSVLDEIWSICKDAAAASEFQVHVMGPQFIFTSKTGRRLAFTIPAIFFNMPQKVSSGSVDFSLDDVMATSEAVMPIVEKVTEEYLAAFPVEYFQKAGFDVEVRLVKDMGSMHRHPGNFGFSGIDLDNQVEKPGVIFRNLKVIDKIQIDSVMYIPGNSVQLHSTETRVVNVEPTEDGGIKGTYERAPTLTYILQDFIKTTNFHEFFGGEAGGEQTEVKFKISKDKHTEEYPEIETVLTDFLSKIDYEPQLIIDPALIVQEFAYNRARTYGKPGVGNANTKIGAGSYWDEYYANVNGTMDEDPFVEEDYIDLQSKPTGTTPSTPTTRQNFGTTQTEQGTLAVRPTWRKVQTLSELRKKGIDVNHNPSISGVGSVKDICAIVIALKAKNFSDPDIREFFTSMDYQNNAMEIYYTQLAAAKKVGTVTTDTKAVPDVNAALKMD